MDLKGKAALITGAASGIGAATARRFAVEGAKVCLNDVRADLLEEVVKSLPPGSGVACAGDVTRLEDVQRMVAATLSFAGKINILVNSAGYDPPGRGGELNLDLWHRILDVNLMGPFLTMKVAIPQMIKSGGGSVINIASLAGVRFLGGKTEYSASKGGLVALTLQAAVEHGPSGIRSNVICPGAVRTPMMEANTRPLAEMLGQDLDWVLAKFSAFAPLRRVGKAEEIAGACYFLASDDSSFVSGTVLMADGGASAVDVNGAAMSGFFAEKKE